MTRIPLIVFGLGKVGRTFVRQLVRNGATLSRRLRLQLVVVGLSQRDYMLLDPSGLGASRLMAIVEGLERGQSLLDHGGGQTKPDNQSLLDALLPVLDERPVVIDATSTEGMEEDLLYALDRDCLLALANARTLVGPWAVSRRFARLRAHGRQRQIVVDRLARHVAIEQPPGQPLRKGCFSDRRIPAVFAKAVLVREERHGMRV